MVDGALQKGDIDVILELATAYPLRVFPDAVGMTKKNMEDLLVYWDLVFHTFGPKNKLFQQSAARLAELSAWVSELCKRENLSPGGFGMAIWEAADRGTYCMSTPAGPLPAVSRHRHHGARDFGAHWGVRGTPGAVGAGPGLARAGPRRL